MAVEEVPLFKVKMSPAAKNRVAEVLDSGYIGQGSRCDELERVLKDHFGSDEVLLLNSCTSALHLAAHIIRQSEEWHDSHSVLGSPMTCFATWSAMLQAGLRIKWCDIGMDLNMDLQDAERKLDENTRILMVVHWGGNPVDMAKVSRLKDKYLATYGKPLHVIEDCAHAWGSIQDGRPVGVGNGNWAAFSFQAIKSLTTGDGGALVAPDVNLYKTAKLLRWFGLDREAGASFRCIQSLEQWGFKYQSNDIAAAIGLANYPEIAACVRRHQDNAAFYQKSLQGVNGVTLVPPSPGSQSSYWIYTLHVARRDAFIRHMTSRGIACSPVHSRCDRHPCVKEFASFLPALDEYSTTMVSIPVGWWVTDADRERIVDAITAGW